MRAIWNGTVIADSDDTISIEGNQYFPRESIQREYFTLTDTRTNCPWKGDATYFTLNVDGQTNVDAAWIYETPKQSAIDKVKDDFSGYVAFRRGVEVR